ncbi:MAG: tetratricopeptide repeat protein [Candidatus Omnitrophota bacterium]
MSKDIRRTSEWRKAERVYNQLHASSVFSLMGEGPMLRPSLEEIDRELEELLEECPDYFPALFQRAEFMLRIGRTAEGEELFDKAFTAIADILEDETEFRVIFSQRIENLEKLLRYDLAVTYLDKALKLFPETAAFYDYLAYYILQLPNANKSKALELQQMALELEPDNDFFINNLGWIYLMMENFQEAEAYFRQAMDYNPENPCATDNLDTAQLMGQQGLTYFEYLIRPVDMKTLNHFFESGNAEDGAVLCRTYNTDRLNAFKMHHLQQASMQPNEMLDVLHPFQIFMKAVEDIVGDELFLYENTDMLIKEGKEFFYQFIVRYDNIDDEFIEAVAHSFEVIYDFLRNMSLITNDQYNALLDGIHRLKSEFSQKIDEYYRVRYNVTLEEEEKERIIEELFGL